MAFNQETAAFALLFSRGHRAIRVEAPEIELEFTDGLDIGRDMKGILRYGNRVDFQRTGNHHYTVYTENAHCVVDFRFPSENEEPYAKFIGENPPNVDVVAATGMNNHASFGNWSELSLTSGFAIVAKPADSHTFTITIVDANIRGTFTHNNIPLEPGFQVRGWIHYKNSITEGVFANYSNDRIVFYENDRARRHFKTLFIPFSSTDDENLQAPNEVFIPGGSWEVDVED